MSILSYAGNQFEVLKTNVFHKQAVYDEVGRYMYTLVRLDVQGLYNPQAMSFEERTFPPEAHPRASQKTGLEPVVTDKALRRELLYSRQQLVFSVNGKELLRCPEPGYSCDVLGGPRPLECTVTSIHGFKSFFIHWVCEMAINEFSRPGQYSGLGAIKDKKYPLLSHTWWMSDEFDPQHFQTRIIRGKAVFRRDQMEKIGTTEGTLVPDDMRRYLTHDQLPRMSRVHFKVWQTDPVTLHYEIVDKATRYAVICQDVAKISLVHSVSRSSKGLLNAIGGMIPGLSSAFERGSTYTGASGKAPWGAVATGATELTSSFMSALPGVTHSANVTVFGLPLTSAKRLQLIAEKVMATRFSDAFFKITTLTHHNSAVGTLDVMGNIYELRFVCNTGMIGGILSTDSKWSFSETGEERSDFIPPVVSVPTILDTVDTTAKNSESFHKINKDRSINEHILSMPPLQDYGSVPPAFSPAPPRQYLPNDPRA